MCRIKRVDPIVKEILEKYPETRSDDFILIAQVYFILHPEITSVPFSAIMLSHKELGLPSLESITRARRKLQEQYEELRASKEVQDIRANEEKEYFNYAVNLN